MYRFDLISFYLFGEGGVDDVRFFRRGLNSHPGVMIIICFLYVLKTAVERAMMLVVIFDGIVHTQVFMFVVLFGHGLGQRARLIHRPMC